MASKTLKRAIGLFSDRQSAEQALIELKSMGFPTNKISAIAKSSERNISADLHNTSQPSLTRAEGAKVGAVTGSAVGGLLTLVAGLGVLLIPGYGPALAVESLLATILGSGAAAAVTGLYGGLRGWLVGTIEGFSLNDFAIANKLKVCSFFEQLTKNCYFQFTDEGKSRSQAI
jgi:hypothetical protein